MKIACCLLLVCAFGNTLLGKPVAEAVNGFGLNLCRSASRAAQVNEVFSPYSLSTALALAMSGAGGETLKQFETVLQLTNREADDLADLRRTLAHSLKEAGESARESTQSGYRTDAPAFHMAARLYGQKDFAFRQDFLTGASKQWLSPLEPVDFRESRGAEKTINEWVRPAVKF
jgi:serpin B